MSTYREIMKQTIPQHRHDQLSDNGIHLKIVKSGDPGQHPADYAHRDDYYIFGVITKGKLCYEVDFSSRVISEGELQFLLPGQIHSYIDSEDFEGWMLMVESSLVDDTHRQIFEKASLQGKFAKPADSDLEHIKALFSLIAELTENETDNLILRHLISAFVGLFAEKFRTTPQSDRQCRDRYMDIVMRLRWFIDTDLAESRSPSYYSGKLNISTVYLNEAVNAVTGKSATSFIRDEIIIRAKRMLFHTDMTVKQIAAALGYEDNAYFTRMFTKATGLSPSKFRQKH